MRRKWSKGILSVVLCGSLLFPSSLGTVNVVEAKSSSVISNQAAVTTVNGDKANDNAELKSYVASQTDCDTGIKYEDDSLLTDSASYKSNYEFEVLKIVNQKRAEAGLSALKMDKELHRASQVRAEEITRYFSHTRPDGSQCFTASDMIYGENIAAGQQSPSSVMDAWMNSEGHRANILKGDYVSIGIACYYVPGSTYGYYWVQNFGYELRNEITEAGEAISTKPPTSEPVATNGAKSVSVAYRTFIQDIGKQDIVKGGNTAGTIGKSKRIEAIQIAVANTKLDLGVRYKTYMQGKGWKAWSTNANWNGASGKGKRVEAIRVELTGSGSSRYDIYYRTYCQDYGWLGWSKNGQRAGTTGLGKRLEAIQIIVMDKGVFPNKGTVGYSFIEYGKIAKNSSKAGMLNYSSKVQSYGQQKFVADGSISGTQGEGKGINGIKLLLNNSKTSTTGGVKYRTRQKNGKWKAWSVNGKYNGTKNKDIEAIQIKVTGTTAKKYDVYYRVHCQNYGWLGWTKNGKTAGTIGKNKRVEAIQVVLVPKGKSAPSNMPNASKKKSCYK